jgi:hypothetical protein
MISRPIRPVSRGWPQPHSAYKYKVVVSTLMTHSSQSKTLATASLIAKGTGGVWNAKHSHWRLKDADSLLHLLHRQERLLPLRIRRKWLLLLLTLV